MFILLHNNNNNNNNNDKNKVLFKPAMSNQNVNVLDFTSEKELREVFIFE